MFHYALPVDLTAWAFGGGGQTQFTWQYDAGREALSALYDKSKLQQWNATNRIDWRHDLDPDNPMLLDDRAIPIHGTGLWERLSERDKSQVRHHHQAYTVSQFLHGEQGALIAAARIVECVPQMDAKLYAATQVMDEARHVEIFTVLLRDKIGLAYPISSNLKAVLEQGLSDARWDVVYLTMQVLIEGLALAAFQRYRDFSRDALISSINAYIMQDEARHVAFGRLALEGYYAELTAAERDERQEFLLEGCCEMLKRFDQMEVWEKLGLPLEECRRATAESIAMRQFREQMLGRVVPTLKHIGLWGDVIENGLNKLGLDTSKFQNGDDRLADDERIAADFDTASRRRFAHIAERLARARPSG